MKDRLVATKRPRLAYIQRDGRLHPLPAASVLGIPTRWGPFIRTPLFSWPGKLRMGMELAIVKRAGDDDESIGAFMERRFGTEAKEYLAEPLLAGIHAGDVDRLSLRRAVPALPGSRADLRQPAARLSQGAAQARRADPAPMETTAASFDRSPAG